MINPGNWLGLLGGGQLGRMFCHAAQRLGYRVAVLEPTSESPAAQVADRHFAAAYDDESALAALAQLCPAVTTEFENVPAQTLEYLTQRVRVTPSASSVSITQNRQREKDFLKQHRFPHVPYWIITSDADCHVPPDAFPAILKSTRFGYDGKGQITVASTTALLDAWKALDQQPCILEKKVTLDLEISVVLARKSCAANNSTSSAELVYFPIVENSHRNGILDLSIAPARISTILTAEATRLAGQIANALNYQGVLCVEMFLVNGQLLVNELAPRPHNSGHYTIDACFHSQFEQQVRVLADLPLGPLSGNALQHTPAVMVNLLGDLWFPDTAKQKHERRPPQEPDWASILALPQTQLHLYGKKEPRLGRKMGHVTCLGSTVDHILEQALRVKRILNIPAPNL